MNARKLSNLEPWSKHLEQISSMNYENVKECYELLMRKFKTESLNKCVISKATTTPDLKIESQLNASQSTYNLSRRYTANPIKIENSFNNITKMLVSLNTKTRLIESMLDKSSRTRMLYKTYTINSRAHGNTVRQNNISDEIRSSLKNIQKLKKTLEGIKITDPNNQKENEVAALINQRKAETARYKHSVRSLFKESNNI